MKQPASESISEAVSERRSFLSRLKFGAVAAIALGGVAKAQQAPAAKFTPARHAQDDWLDQIPGQHRLIFDTTATPAFSDAMLYASNYLGTNRSAYGLKNEDMAVVLTARHMSTVAGYNDEMWAKYGATLLEMGGMEKRDTAPTSNPFNEGFASLSGLIGQGVHLAVCGAATRRVAGGVARVAGISNDEAYEMLGKNLVTNGHLVPAGIVAVSRAQERGYTLVTT